MKIIIESITQQNSKDIVKKLERAYLRKYGSKKGEYISLNEQDIYAFAKKGKYDFIYIEEDGELKASGVYSNYINQNSIKKGFETEQDYYEDYEKEIIYEYINSIIEEEGIYIELIESFGEGCGFKLVEYLKGLNHNKIMLYSAYESQEFWERVDFFKVFSSTYIYPPLAIKELCCNPELLNGINFWIRGEKF